MAVLENRQYQFDFIKGIAIISVILLHAFGDFNDKILSSYTIGQAVPLFITVSCVLGCFSLRKNNNIKNYFKIKTCVKILKRIFLPFLLVQIIIITPFVIKGNFNLKDFIGGGGIGPGSYYPWIYLQLWVLIPFLYLLMKKYPIAGTVIILVMAILPDIIFSLFIPKEWLYRLCVNRYLFIFPLTFLMLYKNIPYKYLLVLAIVGAVAVFAHQYMEINFEPVFFESWQGERFFNHLYTMVVFMFLYKICEHIPQNTRKIICLMGYYSWEIFLAQMIYFTFCGSLGVNWDVNVFMSLLVCIVPICTYDFMKKPMEIKL